MWKLDNKQELDEELLKNVVGGVGGVRVVPEGCSLAKFARDNNTTIAILMRLNQLTDKDADYSGMMLRVF